MSEEFEFSWDFGTENKLKENVAKLEGDIKLLNKELQLRHVWVKHHQKGAELASAREYLTQAKLNAALEELEKHDAQRAKEIKDLVK
jgi:hypothetical protein